MLEFKQDIGLIKYIHPYIINQIKYLLNEYYNKFIFHYKKQLNINNFSKLPFELNFIIPDKLLTNDDNLLQIEISFNNIFDWVTQNHEMYNYLFNLSFNDLQNFCQEIFKQHKIELIFIFNIN